MEGAREAVGLRVVLAAIGPRLPGPVPSGPVRIRSGVGPGPSPRQSQPAGGERLRSLSAPPEPVVRPRAHLGFVRVDRSLEDPPVVPQEEVDDRVGDRFQPLPDLSPVFAALGGESVGTEAEVTAQCATIVARVCSGLTCVRADTGLVRS
jgi:hypothetical protein